MVRLDTYLLAVSLVTGSVLASSSFSDHQRRDELEEELFVRQGMSHLRFGFALGDHSPRELEDNDDLFGRNAFETREFHKTPSFRTVAQVSGRLSSQLNSQNLNRVASAANKFNDGIQILGSFQQRDLEEALVGREHEISIDAIAEAGRRLKTTGSTVDVRKMKRVAKEKHDTSDDLD